MTTANTTESVDWTIKRLIEWTSEFLGGKGVLTPRLATELLLARALGCRKIELYTRFDQVPGGPELDTFREAVRQAADLTPIAYLLGKKEFYSLEFEVTPAVLIPRPETEKLVDQAVAHCRTLKQDRVDVLDFGTGSGCVGLAMCTAHEPIRVVGSDVSAEALEVAGRNAAQLDLCGRFVTVHLDGLGVTTPHLPAHGFDLLVSNPPYVAEGDEAVDLGVRKHEPSGALFAGADGLDFYRLIARNGGAVLKPGGMVFLEIGHGQHDQVVKTLTADARFGHIASWRDHMEGHWRVIQFQRI